MTMMLEKYPRFLNFDEPIKTSNYQDISEKYDQQEVIRMVQFFVGNGDDKYEIG